jgi:hypothetical protein
MTGEVDSASPLVAEYGMQFAKEEYGNMDSEKKALRLTKE